MKVARKERLKTHLILVLTTLLGAGMIYPEKTPAVSFSSKSDGFLLDDFSLISRAFDLSDAFPVAFDVADGKTLSDPRMALAMTINNLPVIGEKKNKLDFNYVFARLQELDWSAKPTGEDVPILKRAAIDEVYEDVYEFDSEIPERVISNSLIGDNPSLRVNNISLTNIGDYLSDSGSTVNRVDGLRIYGIGRINLVKSSGIAVGEDGLPQIDRGIALNRVSVKETQKLQSALQLWPRTPFRMSVGGYGGQTGQNSVLGNFGGTELSVSYKAMPKDIIITNLDTEVNWVDRGEYSENIRQTTQLINDIQRKQQAEFQNRVEQQRRKWLASQQKYQSTLQQRAFNNPTVPGNNLRQQPGNLRLVPR